MKVSGLASLGLVAASAATSTPRRGCLVRDEGHRGISTSSLVNRRQQENSSLPSSMIVDVNIHIASTETEADMVTDEVIAAQWDVLYTSFLPHNITLRLNSTERIVDNLTGSAFFMYDDEQGWVNYPEEKDKYLASSRKGGYDALNLHFFTSYLPGATGYCEFPTVTDGADYAFGIDSCQLSARTMPGVTESDNPYEGLPEWQLGHMAVHETGHWFGLNHTFANGCSDTTGDYVADTPAQAWEVYHCPVGSDTCPGLPGLDPIHNFMGYTADNCTWEFTPGQAERMFKTFFAFRRKE